MELNILLFSLFRTTVFLTLGGLLCSLALRNIGDRLPGLSRILWVAVLLSGWFWVQPVISIPWKETVQKPPVVVSEYEEANAAPVLAFPREPRFESALEMEPVLSTGPAPIIATKSFEWKPFLFKALLTFWLGGMVVILFLRAIGYAHILSQLRKSVPADKEFAEPWNRLLETQGIDARSIPMLISEGRNNLGPALVQTLSGYRLVIPHDLWSELSESGRCGILRHELEHFRRRDVWKSFFVQILALPHWFNPVAHLALYRFEEAAELICDRAAFFGRHESVLEFARTLLVLHENAPTQFVARPSIFGRGLKHRVACLAHENLYQKVSTMKKIMLIAGAVSVLAVFLFRIEFVESTIAEDTLEVAESPVGQAGVIYSSVIEAETKKPLAGAKATLYFAKNGKLEFRSIQTGTDGAIVFPLPSDLKADMEAGMTICVEKEGYVSERDGRQAKWSQRFLKDGKEICTTFQLQKAQTITGRIVDEQGKALPEITIGVLRQLVKPYGNEGLGRTVTFEMKSDSSGKFKIEAAQDEKIVFWAIPDELAPAFVYPNKKRGELGDIVVTAGIKPEVVLLDQDGKPVSDIWVNIQREDAEHYEIAYMPLSPRSALTDKDGIARFRPVVEGKYTVRTNERPLEKKYNPDSIERSVTWRKDQENFNKHPVKGVYAFPEVEFTKSSATQTIQAQKTVQVDIRFSDKSIDFENDYNMNISGSKGVEGHYYSRPSSDSPSGYKGDGLFSYDVPFDLEDAKLILHSKEGYFYRVQLAGSSDWIEPEDGYVYPLGPISQAMTIHVAVFRSPEITLDVVDESGQPVKEYYAWAEYADTKTPATIKFEGDKIRVDKTPERWNELTWEWATSELCMTGILDIHFHYKDFGNSEAKINHAGIEPDREMRLYLVGKGYKIQSIMIPGLKEGETRNLNFTLKR